jgi:predicted neutral ceramidase superfamily lipid hydrolase
MNKFLLSLVLTLTFSVLIVLGVGFFQIMSDILESHIAVLGLGVLLLYFTVYISISSMENTFDDMSILENDDEEL